MRLRVRWSSPVLVLIRAYQLIIRPVIGPRCRFFPSCSDYAQEAIQAHGLWHGGRMTVLRLCRCRPGGGSGYDPVVPPQRTRNRT
jgi:putative membrane protein insertion efficiency factor